MAGWRFMPPIRGTVIQGKQQGRALGYPTANLQYATDEPPEAGVWSCRVECDGEIVEGVAVINMWTMENGLPSLEVHLLDIAEDLYSKTLGVALMTKLRDLKQFSSREDLIEQIEQDVRDARTEFDSLR